MYVLALKLNKKHMFIKILISYVLHSLGRCEKKVKYEQNLIFKCT